MPAMTTQCIAAMIENREVCYIGRPYININSRNLSNTIKTYLPLISTDEKLLYKLYPI